MIFSNVGGSLRKVKISTVLVLYGSCFLYVFISSAIIHIPSADNQPELPAIMKNFSRKAGIDNLQYMCAHYFTIYITPCIGSVMLYSFIILKMREFASNLMAHQERLNVQTPSKVSAVRAVARPMLAYMATFLLLWVPYIFCKLHKSSNENAYVVEIIEKAITGSILILNPIADGMFQASRRRCLLKYIRNSSNQVNSTNQENSQLTSHPHMDNHTKSKENSRPFYNSEYSKQPLYARRRGSDNDTPRISIINTPTQIIMMTTPPMDNLHLSPKGSIELLSPIFYRRKEDSPSRSMSFHTVQSNDCFIESISFRSSLLSVDQGPYSSTPGSIQASSRQSNKRLSVLRCKRSTNASIGHGYVRSSVATNSIPRTSFSSHRSGCGTGSIKK
ncbi:hypothetical protein FSP39_005968 [Pinctada imbricata]|uniref:G-protein coupled receptors family 1 profile domain-containing protein n=1 Tax=Pinctada imbricata TaxID=66713 RepID=A0AA88XF78_PINIB|nr:hypothetical protein FSP39_005968 [Pinctada imbricata]